MKRYSNWCEVSHGHYLAVTPEGQWVKFTDHQAEIAKRDELLKRVILNYNTGNPLHNEIHALLAQKEQET